MHPDLYLRNRLMAREKIRYHQVSIDRLINEKKITEDQLKSIKSHQKAILSNLVNLILFDVLTVEQVLTLGMDDAETLQLPEVQIALEEKRMRFEDIFQLNDELSRQFLGKSIYALWGVEEVSEEEMPLIGTTRQMQQLLDSEVLNESYLDQRQEESYYWLQSLVNVGLLIDINELSARQRVAFNHQNIYMLAIRTQLTIENLKQVDPSKIEFLHNDNVYDQFIRGKITLQYLADFSGTLIDLLESLAIKCRPYEQEVESDLLVRSYSLTRE